MVAGRRRGSLLEWRGALLVVGSCVCALSGLVQCGPAERPRLFVIGLDGATWDLIGPWMEQGEVRNLAALRARCAWGTL